MPTKFMTEFKEFAMRGNVIDLAIGVIIGAAFGKITTALVDDVIRPPLDLLLRQFGNIAGLKWEIAGVVGEQPALYVNYGNFLQAVINFLLIAFVVFLLVRQFNRVRRKAEETGETPSPTTRACPWCLTEIPIKAQRCPACTSDVTGAPPETA